MNLRHLLAGLAASLALAVPAHAAGPLPAVDRYDATRDAPADLAAAIAAAPRAHRQVLVLTGGDWCKDCRELDRLFAADPALAALRDARYVPVKVFVGSENRNEAALAAFPKLSWLPTLFVLDGEGRVVRSAPSTEFHEGAKLDPARVRRFLETRP
ncbi:MAG: thioredoxin family protein [Betaproteobacteria bacterium]|jgi:thiol:disulfide interchange protein|nr:thioredoxin family protein [Betaproteobacteria bacterium]MDH5286104.1 thioredoxin family protein [Betaproteobacteria bacterium]